MVDLCKEEEKLADNLALEFQHCLFNKYWSSFRYRIAEKRFRPFIRKYSKQNT